MSLRVLLLLLVAFCWCQNEESDAIIQTGVHFSFQQGTVSAEGECRGTVKQAVTLNALDASKVFPAYRFDAQRGHVAVLQNCANCG